MHETSTTVQDVLAGTAPTARLRGTIPSVLGMPGGTLVELTDATGTITLFCPPQVAREVRIRDCFEVDVRAREASSRTAHGMP